MAHETAAHEQIRMPRLEARRWTPALCEAAFEIYGDPVAMQFLDPNYPLRDMEAMRAHMDGILERNAGFENRMGSWPLFERDTGALAGTILLKPLPGSTEIEVGWHILRSRWGRGYATEAGRAAITYGREHLGLKTIYAIVAPLNLPSMRVCFRLKMAHLGITSAYHDRELEHFASSPGDWD